jgi:hypothetical protein
MTDEMKDYHLGDVLSITTGCLVSPRHIEGVYDILNFMTGDNLFTHQLPRVWEECRPHLQAQHPQLAAIDASGVNKDNWRAWLDEQVAVYGEMLPVRPVPADAHEQIDPIAEAIAMMGGNDHRVLEVWPDPDDVNWNPRFPPH